MNLAECLGKGLRRIVAVLKRYIQHPRMGGVSAYSSLGRPAKSEPVDLLLSLFLMTYLKVFGITQWVSRPRTDKLLAILSGFDPDLLWHTGLQPCMRIQDGGIRRPRHLAAGSSCTVGRSRRVGQCCDVSGTNSSSQSLRVDSGSVRKP